MTLDYRILGTLQVWAGGRQLDVGGAQQRRLLAALVLAGGGGISADRLVDIVWSEDPPDRARNTLRTYVARARRSLEADGPAPLVTDANGWRLERADDALDGWRFESMLTAARELSADPLSALAALEEALALWRADALVEFEGEDWCAGEAVRLNELRLVAEEERFEAMLGCGLCDDAIGELERFIERHPLRDRSRGQLMLALYRAGRQVEAIRRYQDYRRYLADEVGVEPSEELRALDLRIVNRDPSLNQQTPARRQLRGYQLGPQIGEGAFGRIHRATQPTLGREVAIKVIRSDLADAPEFIRRFDSEAKMIARLEHPHIVPLFDYWREPGGAYLVMRYLRGGNAKEHLASHGPLSLSRVTRIVDEIGGALAAAHAQRVVHGDLKPSNILFDDDGASYLADFGIATSLGASPGHERDPIDGGSHPSPEQGWSRVAKGADIHAFGALVFELLTGEVAVRNDASVPDPIEREKDGVPPDLTEFRPDLTAALDEVIRRAMSPDPDVRYADIADMVAAFHAATDSRRAGHPVPSLRSNRPNPYKGLAAFDEADAANFFGRDQLIDRLSAHVVGSSFVAVVGPSGSGKSSVVRAGLAPRLRREGAYVVSMVPSEHPMEELNSALLRVAPESHAAATRRALRTDGAGLVEAAALSLPDPHAQLVVIVDQFEELFTVSHPDEREEFLRAAAAVADDGDGRVRVVATIRADFFDRPLNHPVISEHVREHTVAVTPLTAIELERAITGPAERAGVVVEPGLVTALVADSAGSPASLPLVQYVLTDLYDRRDSDVLETMSYHRRGGLSGAVAQRADELYEQCDAAGRDGIRRLFGRLVVPGEGTEDTRRRVRRSEVAAVVPSAVIDSFGAARLLTFDHDVATREPTLEVAHEALIREWPRLRRWVDSDRAGLATMRHLATAAASWEAASRDPGELYRGARLLAAEEFAGNHGDQLNPAERSFLEASREVRDAQSALERRRVRRLRQLVASLAVIVVVAVLAGLVAFRQREIAAQNAAEAERRALQNRSAELTSEAMLALSDGDPDAAILLALAAHDASSAISATPQADVVAALHRSVHASRLERIIPAGFNAIAISPDGDAVALDHAAERNRLGIYDIGTGDLIVDRALDEAISGLAYSPDGSLLAVSFFDGRDDRGPDVPAMLVLDSETLATVHVLDGGWPNWVPSWSADGRSVLASGFRGARVWSVGSSAVDLEIDYPVADDPPAAHFVPGTDTIAVARSGHLDLLDRETGDILSQYDAPEGVTNLEVAPGGDVVAFADVPGRVVQIVWLDEERAPITIQHENPSAIAFAPDGTWLSIAGLSDSVLVVAVESGETLELRGHGSGSWRHAYTPDGSRLLAASVEGSTRVWNIDPAGPPALGNLEIGGSRTNAGAVGESELLASVETGSSTARIELLDLDAGVGRAIAEFWFRSFFWPVVAPDLSLVAGFDPGDLVASVVSVRSGETILTLRKCETPLALDAVGRSVLVFARCADQSTSPLLHDARQGFIDLDSGELTVATDERDIVHAAIGHPGSVAEDVVVYHTGADGQVVFRRLSTGDTLSTWEIPDGMIPLFFGFAPDGTTVALSAQSREAVLFDVAAITDGAGADDAVTVFEELTTGPNFFVQPMGEALVVSDGGELIRVVEMESGSPLVDLPVAGTQSKDVFPSPDGESVYYDDGGGVLRRLLLDVDDLAALARVRVQRAFTDVECDRYFPDGDCPTTT